MWKARSSSDQWETGTPTSAGRVVARTRTLWRSCGGKSGRAATAGEVVEAVEAVTLEAAAPLGNGVRVAAELGGDVVVARDARHWPGGAAEDDAGAEGQGLRGGGGVGEASELPVFVGGKADDGCFASHEARSVCQSRRTKATPGQSSCRRPLVQALKCTRMSTLTRWFCETQA